MLDVFPGWCSRHIQPEDQGRPRTRTTTTFVTNLIGVNVTSMFERLQSKLQLFYLKCKRIEMNISSTFCLFFYNEVVIRLSIYFLINKITLFPRPLFRCTASPFLTCSAFVGEASPPLQIILWILKKN